MTDELKKAAAGDHSAVESIKRTLRSMGPIARLAWLTELATDPNPRMRALSLCFLSFAPFPESIRTGVEALM